MNWFKDKYGHWWACEEDVLGAFCPVCGQPNDGGECNHKKMSDRDAREMGALLKKPHGKVYTQMLTWVSVEKMKDAYPNGECPDCGRKIPVNARDGDECKNCGHFFCHRH
jgi:DNA-directed RNA polymerase subunit RPC12/RpoP